MSIYQVETTVVAFTPSGPLTWTAGEEPPAPSGHRAIIAIGESNAGGTAPVSNLPAALSAPTSRVKILVTSSGLFQDMDLGTNNNLGHQDLDSSTHGWEAGFLPYLDTPPAKTEPIYYVQAGQGSSFISQWNNGGAYWLAAQSRINQAKAAFVTLGISPVWEIWISLGYNDMALGTPAASIKAGIQTLLNEVRTMIGAGSIRVLFAEFNSVVAGPYGAQLAVIYELETDDVNLTLVSAPTATPDSVHWTSDGYVVLGQAMAAA
jgi:hypothetical protein